MNLLKSLQLNARRFPRKPAIVFGGEEISFDALYRRTLAMMEQLHELGVRNSDKVAIVAENHPNYLVTLFAATGINAIPVLINYRLSEQDVRSLVTNADSSVLIVDNSWLQLAEKLPFGVRHCLAIDDELVDARPDMIAINSATDITPDRWDADNAGSQVMYHTSGTTGLPKGVLRTGMGFEERSVQYNVGSDQAFLCVLPCCLGAGFAFALWALYIGSTLHLHDKVDYAAISRDIEQYRIQVSFLLPNMLQAWVEEKRFQHADLSSMSCLITGGGYIPDQLRQTLHDKLGDALTIYYGTSELGPAASLSATEVQKAYKDNCIGRPFFGTEVVLLDDDGNEVPTGEVGRICVNSTARMDRYYKHPELIEDITVGKYLSVGDMARFDNEGYLYFVGRERDFIRTGGMNVPAGDVEAALVNHPQVAEVYCVGVPDEKWGEAICAVIIPRNHEPLSAETVINFSETVLPGFKRPRHVLFMADVPKNLTGRVLKHELTQIVMTTLQQEKPQDGY
jgi:acyl-CoA synthetase (AMP-forming)/AMP-acid ligase II